MEELYYIISLQNCLRLNICFHQHGLRPQNSRTGTTGRLHTATVHKNFEDGKWSPPTQRECNFFSKFNWWKTCGSNNFTHHFHPHVSDMFRYGTVLGTQFVGVLLQFDHPFLVFYHLAAASHEGLWESRPSWRLQDFFFSALKPLNFNWQILKEDCDEILWISVCQDCMKYYETLWNHVLTLQLIARSILGTGHKLCRPKLLPLDCKERNLGWNFENNPPVSQPIQETWCSFALTVTNPNT